MSKEICREGNEVVWGQVMLATKVRRVASVLPSATEILCFIDGGEQLLVGRSHEDNYPDSVHSVPILTGQTTTYTTAAEVNDVVAASIGNGESLYTLDVETLVKVMGFMRLLTENLVFYISLCTSCSKSSYFTNHLVHS